MPLPFLLAAAVAGASIISSTLDSSADKEKYSIKEIAQLLGTSEYKVRKRIKELHIKPCEENGRNGIFISKEDVDKLRADMPSIQSNSTVTSIDIANYADELTDATKVQQLISLCEKQLKIEELKTELSLLDYDKDSLPYKKTKLSGEITKRQLQLQIDALTYRLHNLERGDHE